jgi:oxazoline/thiazoline dehydrogenase
VLPAPDLAELQTADWTLTRALESRRSRYSELPVSLSSLAELLFRACRVARTTSTPGEDLVQKVYPSGGSRHSLGIYLVVHKCPGLAPGGYRYDDVNHHLQLLRPFDASMGEIMREARVATAALTDYPPVLLVLTSRIARVTRKYQSNAYRVILQEVGAFYQTNYLVAETLGLAVSAIGGGDSDRFAQVFDTDFFGEPTVGEMIIGGRAGESR